MTTHRTHTLHLGRYELEDHIATGGMGEVWRGRDTLLGRPVAVKLLKREYADDETFRSRFVTEARNAGRLDHPGIATVYDFGQSEEETPRPYIVMELVEGRPLSALLRAGEPMPHATAIDLLTQAGDALGAAHATGLVHRDVKPGNLLVTPQGRVKVTDFGIARAADAVPLTRSGQLMGTPQYLSPEQVEGRPAAPASDVYSLGVVLFECLTGRRPFTGDTPISAALAHLRQPVPEVPDDVLPRWAHVVRRALAKDPAERYADGRAFADALRDEATTQRLAPPAAPPTALLDAPARERPVWWRRVPRWGWLALAALLLVALIAAASAVALSGGSDSRQPGAGGPRGVRVDAQRYLGRPYPPVAAALRDRGLRVRRTTRANDGRHPAGIVAGVRPTGTVPRGSMESVAVWGAPPAAPSSGTTTRPGGSGPSEQPKRTEHAEKPAKKHAKPKEPGKPHDYKGDHGDQGDHGEKGQG